MKCTPLAVLGKNATSIIKREIQDVLREIVIKRDGVCIFGNYAGHVCPGDANDGHLILQADHLITRGDAAPYADSAADMLDSVGPGQILLADRAYDSDALRQNLADRGAWANVKPISDRVNVPAFSPYLYRCRAAGQERRRPCGRSRLAARPAVRAWPGATRSRSRPARLPRASAPRSTDVPEPDRRA
jgi:hypothetical protein